MPSADPFRFLFRFRFCCPVPLSPHTQGCRGTRAADRAARCARRLRRHTLDAARSGRDPIRFDSIEMLC